MAWAKLSRPEQLNESCDYAAKREIYEFDSGKLVPQRSFPLEPITMFVDNEKMTSDTGDHLRFHAHRILAKEFFTTAQSKKSLPLLSAKAFEAIDWPNVYYVLHHVPRLFQLFACFKILCGAGEAGKLMEQGQFSHSSLATLLSKIALVPILHSIFALSYYCFANCDLLIQ